MKRKKPTDARYGTDTGSWEWEYLEDGETHIIRMKSAITDRGIYQPQHAIRWEHGLDPDCGAQFQEAESIVRLMAAAPDLLRACQAVLAALDTQEKGAVINARDLAMVAIWKATKTE